MGRRSWRDALAEGTAAPRGEGTGAVKTGRLFDRETPVSQTTCLHNNTTERRWRLQKAFVQDAHLIRVILGHGVKLKLS